jgi:hypothetical protein
MQDKINTDYHQRLYRLGAKHRFLTDGIERTGEIVSVSEKGFLNVNFSDVHRTFGFKEIEFVI